MVTGSLPYISEASINDPLYKYLYRKKRDHFWEEWKAYTRNDDQEENKKKETRLCKSKNWLFNTLKKLDCRRKRNAQDNRDKPYYVLAPKDEQTEEVVVTAKKDYSDDFKDLVAKLLSYHFYDRLSLEQMRNHPWMKEEIP